MASVYDRKSALITGGSSGIGLALAKHLYSQGANITILARRPEQLEAACREIDRFRIHPDQRVDTIQADIANRPDVLPKLDAYVKANGTPDYLFNNAGITEPGLFEDQPLEDFDRLMQVNYIGTVNVTKAILPGMIERGSGYIVITGSLGGVVAGIGYSAYGATKFALRGLADVLRVELKPKGIKVSYVAPSDTDTPQLAYETPKKPEITKALVGSNTVVQTPENVAKVVAKDVARGKYFITPGAEVTLYYYLSNTFGLLYPLMDIFLAGAWKKVERANGNGRKQNQG